MSIVCVFLLISGASAQTIDRRAAIAACNASEFASVLHPAPVKYEASAYWLSQQFVKWPGASKVGRFSLYYSALGQIQAVVGAKLSGADGVVSLAVSDKILPVALTNRFKFVENGLLLRLADADLARMPNLHKQQIFLVQEDPNGVVLKSASLQIPGALDDLYSSAKEIRDLGVHVTARQTSFKLWAPTAQVVGLCLYDQANSRANTFEPMQWNANSGIWSLQKGISLKGKYYQYLLDVYVPGVGVVRNRVTDPYSISLSGDSKRSYIAQLDSPALQPKGWGATSSPRKDLAQTDMAVYELHVRDFSINDATVGLAHRGKYLAFTEPASRGMRHLQALAQAGITDVHLLPVFDFASVPEKGCVSPLIQGGADSETQQASSSVAAGQDCYNWGYDPFHYNAPEGSYSTNADDGAKRIFEFRQMVQALHKAGLRVGMDVVYNHTDAVGQKATSVLDRIVPGYYHRLDALGQVEQSTCTPCGNTATENMMMGKLMIDSVLQWATQYKIDSFRFDLMAHQPRAVMEELQAKLRAQTGREIQLLGEGWNFGEVANGARFVQASQLSLNGTGIATFSDRGRDAVRGGGAGDTGADLMRHKGYINGLADQGAAASDLAKTADMVRVGLTGSLRDFSMTSYDGSIKNLEQIDYAGQPAAYVSEPAEVVNYVENHDNQTLFDINVYKLPQDTSRIDRVRVQMLGVAITAFSQGIAYFHAGVDILRSKSMDRNSYNSGDWFNRLDWSYQDNYFATGLPPKADNADAYPMIAPLLANSLIKPGSPEIALARDMFRDLLKIRSSSSLFRLRSAADVRQRLHFDNLGVGQNAAVIVGHLDGAGYSGANFKSLRYFINVATNSQQIQIPDALGIDYVLHPVHTDVNAADKRIAAMANFNTASGSFSVPARSAVVFVQK
ncbi:alpha-1,6-glucosidase domain-containing protein [Undibacterium parvum]|uniref:alpha-1,6-glucosidase domain-containing protein n=1 Tax=Undibacterium parvum TaxID=401471 RepID=UPI001D1312A3|nr:alpha-1,6-glucosidase domain-containing protein [Undibacterium parvum]